MAVVRWKYVLLQEDREMLLSVAGRYHTAWLTTLVMLPDDSALQCLLPNITLAYARGIIYSDQFRGMVHGCNRSCENPLRRTSR
jgi:hypothetical protein